MPGSALETIRQFGAVEEDQRYGRLASLFTDDAIYYDPFYGPQRGRQAITEFLAHMEQIVPGSGVRFADWHVEADRTVGWATWQMIAPHADGSEIPVPGQSLYRLNDAGLVTTVIDYVDARSYSKLAPDRRPPNAEGAAGISASPGAGAEGGPALAVVRRFWEIQEDARYAELGALFADDAVFTDIIYGRFEGRAAIIDYLTTMQAEMPGMGVRFELVDAAGDETVAWSQWTCHFPNGPVPGWTLHTVRGDLLTLDADYFDTAAARALSSPSGG